MEPITLTHLQGKAILSGDTITLSRSGFSGLATREIPLAQINAIRHTTTMMGGALAISLQLEDATTVDLKLVTPVAAARQFVAAVETSLAARAPVAPAIIEGAAVAVAPEPASPVAPALQPAPQVVVVAAPTAPPAPPEQMIKIYRGPDCAKHFQKEAKKLARKGWRVQSQTYGGQAKSGAALLIGLAAARKPNEMTVVYVRN